MSVGVARRRDDPDPQGVADVDDVTVAGRDLLVGNLIGRAYVVGRAGHPRQSQAPGDVVVVDMGLEDVGDPYTSRVGKLDHFVDVTLRVDHEGHLTVMGQVVRSPRVGVSIGTMVTIR